MLPPEVQELLTKHLGENLDESFDLHRLDERLGFLGYRIDWDIDGSVYDLQIKLS